MSSEALERLQRQSVARGRATTVIHRADLVELLAELRTAEDALAVAREREQRLREAVIAWDNSLSSYCDGPERDAVRAALADEPAATLAEPEPQAGESAVGAADSGRDSGSVISRATVPGPSPGEGAVYPPETGSGSASAAADEPTLRYPPDDVIVGKSTLTYGDLRRAAADEPGETP